MYFTKIRLIGASVIDLPIVGAKPSDTFILKNGLGLGPPEVDVSIINTLNAGGFYQGRRTQTREIVLHIGLNPVYGQQQTVSDLRRELYGMLTPGIADLVEIQIMNSDLILGRTTGYVKKMEIVPFSQTPEAQITISCLEQYFEAPGVIYLDPGDTAVPIIDNKGTAPTGFFMSMIFSSYQVFWWFQDFNGRKMRIDYEFDVGDRLDICTHPGARGIWFNRGGVSTNIIFSLSKESIWHMLHSGENIFQTSSPEFTWGDVYYLPRYWGI